LVEYFCIRLENKDNIPNFRAGLQWTAKSLQALAKMTARFPRGDASAVAKAIFPLASSFRDQLPATRLAVLNLLGFLGETYSTPLLRDIGAHTFVEGLVSMAEFEKDPYCLKFLFQQYQKISENWALKSESYKSMWDSFSRYYPITLKTTDKSVPSRDELQLLLIGCFASNNGYAAHALPFLLDALDMSEDTLTSYTKVSFKN
jgi:DNA repair/transcription protein MET18/MMS19